MLEKEVRVGKIYRHFKGTLHRVLFVAKDSETLDDMVVYTHEGKVEICVRPISMFLSEVDHDKYPEVEQKYRFELVD